MGVHTDASQLTPLLASGYQLLPLHKFSAQDEVKGKKRKRGKSPIDSNWMKRPYKSQDQIKHMEAGNNVGVRLKPFDLVLDVDPRAFPDGQTLASPINPFVELVLWTGMDPDLYSTVETGSGGLHIYMAKPEDVSTRDSLNDQFPGIEFKTVGRQVVAPGSVHPDSLKTYTWKADTPELGAFGAEAAPKALVDLIRRPSGCVATGGGEHDQEELAQMLEHLDPTDFADHDDWLTLMQACHHATAGDGRQELVDWCTQDPAYADHGTLIRIRWDSLHANNDGNRITLRTLHKMLRDAGAEDAIPRTLPADDFNDDLDQTGVPAGAIAKPQRRPVHEGGLMVNKKTGVAPDTAKNALKAITGSKLDPRFDELKQRVVLMGELPWGEGYGRVLTDKLLLLARTFLMEQHQRKDYQPSKENVQDAITTVAYLYKFNPILDYLDGLTWDGTSRVKDLFTIAFQCGRDDYTEAVSQCFMVGAVARQRQPGCKLDTMPVIKGPQGSLKSTGIRDLFSPDWFSDAELGDLRNKDAAMNLEGVWVHEFAELAGLRASDMDVLKAFMSRAIDRYRTPYDRNTKDHQRRVVFAGTVNEGGYLSDPTGARRFWPLEMASGSRVDLGWIAEHRDQLWAEADALFKSGIGHVLPEPLWSMAAERQADETVDDPWVDSLAVMLSNRQTERQAFEAGTGDYAADVIDRERVASPLREPPSADKVHTQDLLSYLGLESDRQNKGHAQRLRRSMETLGWKHKRGVRLGGRVSAGYVRADE